MPNLYMVDERAPGAETFFRSVRARHAALMVMRTDPITELPSLARQAIALKFPRQEAMSNLLIVAHGSPGFLQLGSGLTAGNADVFVGLRPLLRHAFPSHCSLFGCNVGADEIASNPITEQQEGNWWSGWGNVGSRLSYTGTRGYVLLHRLAMAVQLPVHAGTNEQNTLRAIANFRFEGPVLRVQPSGEFTLADESAVLVDSRFDF
jgi:hypothetical protein